MFLVNLFCPKIEKRKHWFKGGILCVFIELLLLLIVLTILLCKMVVFYKMRYGIPMWFCIVVVDNQLQYIYENMSSVDAPQYIKEEARKHQNIMKKQTKGTGGKVSAMR
jgi:hypothetical protein